MSGNRRATTEAEPSFRQILEDRFSCRAFRSEQVSDYVIEDILALAQRTASWCNSQPWQVLVTSGQGTERFRQAYFDHAAKGLPPTPDLPFPGRYVGIYKERQRECGWQLYSQLGIAFGDRDASGRQVLENFRLFGAPHAVILTSERDLGVYGVLDCGGYVSNFMLAAKTFGVASVAQAALAMHGEFIREYFAIPDNRMIVCGMSFGYPDLDHPANQFRTTRAATGDVVSWVRD